MGWDDRGYSSEREDMHAYLANPAALLQYALPIFRSPGLQIRLSIWFILSAIFLGVEDFQAHVASFIPFDMALLLGVCLWHEYGHRVFSRLVGGNHWEWVLWPAGGMVPPTAPATPWAKFVAHVGGIAFNAILLAAVTAVVMVLGGAVWFSWILIIPVQFNGYVPSAPMLVNYAFLRVMTTSMGMILINLFPCYWFDGGYIWQSVLWPRMGQWKAIRVTCMAGMILAVPLLLLSLWGKSLLGMVVAGMIFADCFRRRQALAAAGPGVMDESEESTYNYMNTPEPRRKKLKKRWFKTARKRASHDQAEQAKIDGILAKVKEKGLHSLTWWERRTLKKATERQRQRDMANRF